MRRTRRNRKSQMRTKRGGMWPFSSSAAVEPEIDPATGLPKPRGIMDRVGSMFSSSTPAQNAPLPSEVLSQPAAVGGRRRRSRRQSRRRR